MNIKWTGVFPAITTKFKEDSSLDYSAMEKHFNWQIESGVDGIVVVGSLGENGVLSSEEKQEILKLAVSVSNGRVPVLAGVSEATTTVACAFVEKGNLNDADGFMVLPPVHYCADRRETLQYLRTIAKASQCPIMIYNNPVNYGVDVTPEMFAELADEEKFVAIKESSNDVCRITDLVNLVKDRYQIFTGVDNLALESLLLGATGWVAGLVNAFPQETVVLYQLAKAGHLAESLSLYRWFMPLLHLDVSLKLVQNIKLTESIVGVGSERVRLPRLPLVGEERAQVEQIINHALAKRPVLPGDIVT